MIKTNLNINLCYFNNKFSKLLINIDIHSFRYKTYSVNHVI